MKASCTALILAMAVAVNIAHSEDASTGKNWKVYRGDTFCSGVAKSDLPEKLDVLWKFTVENGAFAATPAIVDGVVYIGDLDGKLFALDLATGKTRWEFQAEIGFFASPSIRDDALYVGDMDGKFYCLELKSGKLKWSFEAQGEINSSANFYKDNVLVGSQDATLYCLNANGELVWKHTINDQIRCTPTVVENRCFLAGCDGVLHIVNLDSGEGAEKVRIDSPTGTTPAVMGNFVFFGTEGGTFYCVDWRMAAVKWTYAAPKGNQPFRSSAAVTEDIVIVGSRNKRVHGLNPKTGVETWMFPAKQRVDSSPVIVGNRAFVGSADGRLYGLDVKTGKEVWQFEAGDGFSGSPAVASGRLVIASDDGVVFCFGKKE